VAEDKELGLGSYAFTWGSKQEATATWYGLLLPDGSKTGAVDALTKLWTGKEPANHAPVIKEIKTVGDGVVEPGATVEVKLDVTDPEGDDLKVDWVLSRETFNYNTGGDAQAAPPTYPDAVVKSSKTGATVEVKLDVTDPEDDDLKVDWVLSRETFNYNTGGDAQAAPPTYPDAVVKSSKTGATVKMPTNGGGYRLFVEIRDGQGKAAVANVPLKVDAPATAEKPRAMKLPYTVVGDDQESPAFYPSGWMGDAGDVEMNETHADNPRSGKTCIRVTYSKSDGWAGVVWQNPANDWGDAAGGRNFEGAKKMTFQARGETGGEKVKVGLGIIGRDKKYYDTAKAEQEFELTQEWKRYSIDLTDKDLTRIKTPFYWVLAGQGQPVTFYLDDIRYE